MKKSVLIFIVFFSIHQVFAAPSHLMKSITTISDSGHLFKSDITNNYDLNQTTIWPRKRRGCHGGKKQKRRNKRRIKRSRKS